MKYLIALVITTNLFAAENLRLINVDGIVERAVKPDLVSFNLKVWAKADKAREALKNQIIEEQKLKKGLEKFSIDSKDIMSISFDVNPSYKWEPKTGKNILEGYEAQETISITLRKIEDVGRFLDEIASGDSKQGVSINSLSWDTSKRIEIGKELLTEAVNVARVKAENLATAAKVKIKNVHYINPQNFNEQPVMMNMKIAASEDESGRSFAKLNEGQIKISSTVNVQFEIE